MNVLVKSIREYKRDSILSPLFVSLEVILECLIPLVMASMIDDMTGTSIAPVLKYGAILVVMAFASLYCGKKSGEYAARASAGFAKNLRQDQFFKIQEFSFSDIDAFSAPSLVTRMTTDVTNVQNAYQMIIRIAIRGPLMIIVSVLMCLTINKKMALIFLALVPVIGAILLLIVKKVSGIFRKIFREYDDMNNSVQENVSGIRVVKAFVRAEYEKKRFHNAAGNVCNDFTYAEKIMALNTPIMTFCIYLAIPRTRPVP